MRFRVTAGPSGPAARSAAVGAAGGAVGDDRDGRLGGHRLLEQLDEHLGRLGAGGGDLAVDDEERDAADAERRGGALSKHQLNEGQENLNQ